MTTYYEKLQLKLSEMTTDNMIPPKPKDYETLEDSNLAKLSYDEAMVRYSEQYEELKQKVYEAAELDKQVESSAPTEVDEIEPTE